VCSAPSTKARPCARTSACRGRRTNSSQPLQRRPSSKLPHPEERPAGRVSKDGNQHLVYCPPFETAKRARYPSLIAPPRGERCPSRTKPTLESCSKSKGYGTVS